VFGTVSALVLLIEAGTQVIEVVMLTWKGESTFEVTNKKTSPADSLFLISAKKIITRREERHHPKML
jgi:hypothetical protein